MKADRKWKVLKEKSVKLSIIKMSKMMDRIHYPSISENGKN